jgi:hypothetical protein
MRRTLLSIIGCVVLATLGLGAAQLPAGAAPGSGGEVNPPACADPHGWQFKAGQGNPYRLWFPDHNHKAAELATFLRHQMDEKIWPKETNLMNTTPVANTQDICLVDTLPKAKGIGHTTSAGVGCGHKSATVEMLNSLGDKDAEDVLAHEFFHVLQFSLDVKCSDTIWWRESTALWAEDFVYPDDNREQQFASNYLQDMDKPLNDACDCQEEREYGSYLFPFFIAHTFSPDLVAQIWHKAQDEDILDAIDDVLPGGLDKQWPEFALDAWNAKPRDEFQFWDGLDDGASKEYGDPIKLKPGDDDGLSTGDLKHMSVKYFSFDVESGVRTVALQNGYPYFQIGGDKNKHAGVHAIVELADGSLEVKDWTNEVGPNYCLALSGQHVKTLTIVYTNAGKTKDFDSTDPSYLVASNIGCKSWTVKASSDATTTSGGHVTTTATATFKRVPSSPESPVFYTPVSGTVNWTGTYSADGCTGSGDGSLAIDKDSGYLTMYWNAHNVPGFLPTRGYGGLIGGPLLGYEIDYTCPNDSNTHAALVPAGTWDTGPTAATVSGGGLSAHGHWAETTDEETDTWDWTMTSSG